MAANTLVFTLLSGLILLAMVVLVLRLRRWRRDPGTVGAARSADVVFADALHNPTTWTVGFLVLVLVAVAGALAMVGALPVPESAQPIVGTAMLVGLGLVLGGFVFAGVYASVRNRGYGSAPAAGMGSLVLGLLALLVVVTQLFLG